MSTEMIVVASILGLGALIGLFYVSHAIEKQRRQKALMIANLSDYAFRLQRLLDFIPDAYLNKDVRLLLLGQIHKRLEKLVELTPGNDKFTKKLESCNAQIADVQASGAPAQVPQLKTPEEANELRVLLQELSKVIEHFVQTKAIAVADAQKHLNAIQTSFIEANINYMLQMGQSARQEKKPKLAIHHYQKAMAEMSKRNQNGKYTEKLKQLQLLLTELQTEAGIQEVQPEDPGASELNAGLNELLEEQDAWKKKYF